MKNVLQEAHTKGEYEWLSDNHTKPRIPAPAPPLPNKLLGVVVVLIAGTFSLERAPQEVLMALLER